MFVEAATDLREMKSGVALLWKAPKAYDSHRDKLLRRVDAETEHSWVAKKRSLGCLPFESFILGNVLCLRCDDRWLGDTSRLSASQLGWRRGRSVDCARYTVKGGEWNLKEVRWLDGQQQLQCVWAQKVEIITWSLEPKRNDPHLQGTARSRQKSYADKRRKPLEFQVGDRVLLKVSPWKGVVRFGKKGKLAPRYVGPFEIVECVGPVAYRLKLPQELSCVHDTFHVSNLKKCLAEPDVQVPLDEIEIDENLRFVEEPIEIVERDVKKLKRRRIPLVKVRWNSRQGAEYTWEREDQFQKKYPHLFSEPVPSSSAAT
ncbi:putative reverse transcriptase domain-containing protein [Tanacetum coccineum]